MNPIQTALAHLDSFKVPLNEYEYKFTLKIIEEMFKHKIV